MVANMRSLSILCLLLISASFFPSECAQSPTTSPAINKETATVGGNVVRLDTGEPLKKAKVILQSHVGDAFSDFLLTDELGHFVFENIPPGSYDLQISHNGYVDAEYGQKKLGAPGAVLSLSPGQRMTDLVFKLARAAAISGHVFDEDGEPIAKAEVISYLASKKFGKEHRNNYEPISTNDLGEFRIFDLAPGRYYLAVNYHNQEHVQLRSELAKQKFNPGYLPSYYPNTTDPAKAQAIYVGSGDDIRSVDFFLRPSHLVTVTGKVISTIPVPANTSGMVTLYPRGSGLVDAAQDLDDTFQLKDGSFVIRNVPPGSYFLAASWSDHESGGGWHFGRRRLDVANSDVEVAIMVSRGSDIAGHVSWEGVAPSDLRALYVRLQSLDEDPMPIPGASAKQDGTLQFKNVPEGTYRPIASFPGAQENFYLKAARYGTATVTEAGFTVQPGSDASLDLIMGTRAAQIDGVVLNADSLPTAGSTVVLIPDPPHRDVKHRYKAATTDQNGKFTIKGIAPGDYKLFSWDLNEGSEDSGSDWYDPEWLKPYETEGEAVHLDESDRKAVNLTLIETRSDSSASN
jgi:hypothetical protein